MKSMRVLLSGVVAGLVGLLVLSGCSVPGGSVAATVNGVDIPVSRVEGPVTAIGGADGDLANAHAIVLSYAIRAEVSRTIAAQQGIALTGESRTAMLTANPNLTKYEGTDAQSFVDDVIDSGLVLNKIGDTAFLAEMAKASVQVNPRYGSWSAESAAVSQDGGQLSQPWVTPSAAP